MQQGLQQPSVLHDEGLVKKSLCVLQIPVERPSHLETTSLGAAFAAGIGSGFWTKEWVFSNKQDNNKDSSSEAKESRTWQPQVDSDTNSNQYAKWKKAVALSFGLADLAEPDQEASPSS